jgi:5'-methylthioadenosine phosphorylase
VLAKEAGLCYASVGLVTDYDCWRETGNKVCVDEVMHNFKSNVQNLIALLKHIIPIIANDDWDEVIDSIKVCRMEPVANNMNDTVCAREAVFVAPWIFKFLGVTVARCHSV